MRRLLLAGLVAFLSCSLAGPIGAQGNLPPHQGRGRHPEIRQALNKLRNAKMHLQQAAHDYGGHRAEAVQAIDNAIGQLEVCLKYD